MANLTENSLRGYLNAAHLARVSRSGKQRAYYRREARRQLVMALAPWDDARDAFARLGRQVMELQTALEGLKIYQPNWPVMVAS